MNTKLFVLLLVSVIIGLAASKRADRVLIAHVVDTPPHFDFLGKASIHDHISFKILLTQRNLDKLEEKFWDISNPKSSNYGKFMTKAQIDKLIAPVQSDKDIVVSWLNSHSIQKSEIKVFSDYIQVNTIVKKASELLSTKFYRYASLQTSEVRIRIGGTAYIPSSVSKQVELILGVADFIEDNKMEKSMRESFSDVDPAITPDFIKKFYGIPTGLVGTNNQTYQSIVAFTDDYAPAALAYFDKTYSISNVKVNRQGPDCIAQGCDQMESDLDIQYHTSIGNNITTLFINHAAGQWVLDWATSIQEFTPLPMVSSLSYGFAEVYQCLLEAGCGSLGIDATQYIARTNVELQKLGNQGMTIFVSSGDDGAPGFYGTSGNCPMALEPYCPIGGCNFTETQCAEFTITSPNGTICIFPMGLGSFGCQEVLRENAAVTAIQAFFGNNTGTDVDKDRGSNEHFYSPVSCDQLETIHYEDFTVAGYSFSESQGTIFMPDFPTSSPYVVSVGATQILSSGSEVVCSIVNGAAIVGGGGFSMSQPQPSYQTSAVNTYLNNWKSNNPSFAINITNRAYPDIALVGHNFQIATTNNLQSENCPCSITAVDGTSCSSPTVAAMFSLINDQLLNNGKTQLGFLNPLLYQAGSENPDVYNDITTGNNNCNRAYCCEYGFSAEKGYDLASGWGSINFPNMLSYILSTKGVNNKQ
ncbi:peptidase S8 and S53 domain-containing protein [Tieghemostelium lacteum]|uniref:Peptidase S8 and S53 domain-containing protein n=1 Tax=Tieghemostelium lacteum TaxID=361077 RepID=A0A151ZIG1_TIELA|nr:peptidase S8 and S53 domain-containing protein [Tieghemostelium lacteum]|eukprot:KYQ93746.1 peptidase S8 and S53 domain-containing protein [Tieghemostelium lacteum]